MLDTRWNWFRVPRIGRNLGLDNSWGINLQNNTVIDVYAARAFVGDYNGDPTYQPIAGPYDQEPLPAVTNLLAESIDFTNPAFELDSPGSITITSGIADPFGGTNAFRLADNNGYSYIVQYYASGGSSLIYYHDVWMRVVSAGGGTGLSADVGLYHARLDWVEIPIQETPVEDPPDPIEDPDSGRGAAGITSGGGSRGIVFLGGGLGSGACGTQAHVVTRKNGVTFSVRDRNACFLV